MQSGRRPADVPDRERNGRCALCRRARVPAARRRPRTDPGNGSRCARRSGPRSARCPWRRAVCPACAACRVSLQPRLRTFQRIAQIATARPGSSWSSTEGAIGRWRPRRVRRVPRQTLRKFDRHRVQSAKKFDPRRRVKGLEECAVHSRKIDRWLVRHARK